MLYTRAPRGLGILALFAALLASPSSLSGQAPSRRYAVDAVIAQLEAGVSVARILTLVMEGCVVDGPPTTAQAATLGRLGATGALLNALEKNPCARAPAPAGPAVTPTTVVPDSVRMQLTACDGGDASACVWVGYWYETGRGVPVDLPQAVRLYQRGCEGGDAVGCNNLGTIYERGRGVPVDRVRAQELYRKACSGGDTTACGKG